MNIKNDKTDTKIEFVLADQLEAKPTKSLKPMKSLCGLKSLRPRNKLTYGLNLQPQRSHQDEAQAKELKS